MLFTTRRCQDGTPTPTPPLRAPARGVDNGSGQQQAGLRAYGRRQGQRGRERPHRREQLFAGWKRATSTEKTERMQRRKIRGATMTRITGQDDTDNDNDNDGDQGIKTNDEDNHKTTTDNEDNDGQRGQRRTTRTTTTRRRQGWRRTTTPHDQNSSGRARQGGQTRTEGAGGGYSAVRRRRLLNRR